MDIAAPNSGRVCADQLTRSIQQLGHDDHCTIDLRRALFVDPAGLVAIAVSADRAVHDGQTVEFLAPTNINCANYLSRMQLPKQLAQLGVEHNLPSVASHDPSNSLEELQRFDSESDLEQVADTIVNLYAAGDAAGAQPLYDALFELGVNAVQHSGRGAGYVALQSFTRSQDVAFAVGDSGQGLLGTLRSQGIRTDAAAIRAAARKYFSSAAGRGRGRGITGVIELTSRHRGQFSILTGSAFGEFRRGSWDPRVTRANTGFLGTLAHARFDFEGGR